MGKPGAKIKSNRGLLFSLVTIIAIVAAVLLVASVCAAGVRWTANGVTICDYGGSDETNSQITSDGSGGAIVTWHDSRGPQQDIYAQKVDAAGSVQWAADGVAICNAANDQVAANITSDGSGGAIITWCDNRQGNYDIYAQRVDGSGTLLWTGGDPTLGVAICTANNDQEYPLITPDRSGGAIITWEDERDYVTTENDIYAQRVDSGGNLLWTGGDPTQGVAICTASDYQGYNQITSDGTGGAIISWVDYRNGSYYGIYAQRVDSDGGIHAGWTANGVELRTAVFSSAHSSKITGDGSGGAIVTWEDYRSGYSNPDIYAQKVLSGGSVDPIWPVNGVAICTATNFQVYPQITPDGSGGAIITWRDSRDYVTTGRDIYAQRVNASGAPQWTTNGVAVCNASENQSGPQITGDGSGGAIITWHDWRSGIHNEIYAQRVDANGGIHAGWTVNGVELRGTTLSGNASYPRITRDDTGGAIVTWEDERSGDWDIYAQRVSDASPTLTGITPTSGFIDDTVTLNGSDFGTALGTVYFGSKVSNKYKSWSNTRIKVKVPSGVSKQLQVKVKTSAGVSNTRTFKVRPKIKSLKPKSGKKGKTVTIKGNAFGKKNKSSKVYFINKKGKKKAAKIKSWKGTQIKVKVPRSIKGKVKVKVKTSGGMSNPKSFTIKK